MTCVAYVDFFIIFHFILFYHITSFLNHISWLFGHEETSRHLFGRRINKFFFFFKKKEILFLKGYHIYYLHGGIGIKGKKIRKESRFKKEEMRGFFSSRFGGFLLEG